MQVNLCAISAKFNLIRIALPHKELRVLVRANKMPLPGIYAQSFILQSLILHMK
jgi:hypothetical protein